MFENLKEKIVQREKLVFTVLPFIIVLIIFANANTLKSFFVGIPFLFMYLIVNGEILGRAFFEDEKPFFRLTFGLFLFIVLMALTGILAVLISQIDAWYFLGMLFASIVSSLLNLIRVKYSRSSQREVSEAVKPFFKSLFVRTVYASYIATFLLCFVILLNERSGWVLAQPSIWAVIPAIFLRIYFISTAILVGIMLLPGKMNVKLLLVALHSTFSLLFVPIILYPGVISLEAWYDLGRARVMLPVVRANFPHLSIRGFSGLLKGFSLQVLTVAFAGVLNIDMYWSDVLIVPILWGFFVPLTSYKLTEMIGGGKRASIFAAFLTIPNLYFLAWAKLSISDSTGFLFLFLLLYLLLRFLSSRESGMFLPIFITLAITNATHFLPGIVSISFTALAFALKKYERIRLKFLVGASFFLFFSFVLAVFLLPLSIIGRGILLPMLGESSFSVDKILRTSIWSLVFGLPEDHPLQAAMFTEVLPLLGLIGLVYALQRKAKFNRTLCVFLFGAFGVSLIDHRILAYAIEGGLFGAARVNFFREVVVLPFAAVVIASAAKSLFGTALKTRSFFTWKNVLAVSLICIGLSSWASAAVYETYRFYTWGLMSTSLEVETIKYIDEHTDGSYVAFVPSHTEVIAWGFIGYPYPSGKQYIETKGVPSIADMYQQMKGANADVGYFVVPSFRIGDVDNIIEQASRIFGIFEVLSNENGDVYIFYYNAPPLPRNSDVMAFYWDTPPTYYVQNNKIRIIINPATKSLDVYLDFWGDFYESIELNRTLVGGNLLGNLTSIEYFDVMNNRWVEWSRDVEIPPATKFQFKLGFENDSLIGLVEKGEGSIQLRWESGRASNLNLNMGVFERLYIPGLMDGKDSYDVNSREFGFLYTRSLTENVMIHPAYKPDMNVSYLTYSQILHYGGFSLGEGYMSYDLYVHNYASLDQWAYIEVWLPDYVYTGSFPPLYYSVDNGTKWVYPIYDVETGGIVPIRTNKGAEVNWIFTAPKTSKEKPTEWWSFVQALGGSPRLPENYTNSGGAQNRIIFGLYLPAGDEALLRIGASVYEPRPLKLSYVFTDSDDINYGLRNMNIGSIKLYNLGVSEYVGGITITSLPTSLVITQDEANRIKSILVTVPYNAFFLLLSVQGVDTTIDTDEDGIPDLIKS